MSVNATDSDSSSSGHNYPRINQPDLPFQLNGSQKKTAFALRHNCERMISQAGVERIGFATFTVGDEGEDGFRQVWDADEASRRWKELSKRLLPSIFKKWIVVTERHKSGAIHFHLVGVVAHDIRTGFDFDAVARGDYSSVCPALLRIWAVLRSELPSMGFGRAEVTPVRKCGEAVSSYVAKYVEKNLFNRLECDRGKRLVRYGGWKKSQLKPNEFSWATPGATRWRIAARFAAKMVGIRDPQQMAEAFGARWAYIVSGVMGDAMGSQLEMADFCDMVRDFMLNAMERSQRKKVCLREWEARVEAMKAPTLPQWEQTDFWRAAA